MINSAENEKQLIGILSKYLLTADKGIEDLGFRKSFIEVTPGMTWEESIGNCLVVRAVLS